MAMTGLYYPRWTKAIEGEFIKNFGAVIFAENSGERKSIKATHPDPAHIAKAEYRLNCFRSAVGPEYEVLLYDTPAFRSKVPSTVHAGDIHVASAALVLHNFAQEQGDLDKVIIVSDNLAHLAVKEMKAIGIGVVSPGDFINKLSAAAPAQVEIALFKTINDLTAPPYSREDALSLLLTHGAKQAAQFYAQRWSTI